MACYIEGERNYGVHINVPHEHASKERYYRFILNSQTLTRQLFADGDFKLRMLVSRDFQHLSQEQRADYINKIATKIIGSEVLGPAILLTAEETQEELDCHSESQ